ncbi:cytochrome c oxidase subunit II [Streptomonospora sp. DSM 45055]|uniref:cytochrome-c oxidase n=1 Tax=Streptomonospora wellingtoniae TaxID=3075544 RepID=A0ABU2KP58_9ACTN|nr:cytochrome c oxidase subunit II [Streptomonospora sp. DSM 45055]MDT0301044.1 cytochrome c oxidase subunit II [Streptomonospora sp. DSM 45055]
MPEPITEQGQRVLTLWQGSWVAAFAVGILVWGLIVWSVIFHRKRSEQLPPQVRYNMPIEALYTVLPIVIIAVLFYFTARDQTALLSTEEEADTDVEVVAFQWSWQFNYQDQSKAEAEEQGSEPQTRFSVAGTPENKPTLVLREGDVVHFDLTSPDVIHSFWIPAFTFKMDVIPHQDNEFQVKVKEGTAGTYAGRCAELCGVDHSRMLFTLKVMEPEDYDAWVEKQEAKAQEEQQETAEQLESGAEDPGTGIDLPGPEGEGPEEEVAEEDTPADEETPADEANAPVAAGEEAGR